MDIKLHGQIRVKQEKLTDDFIGAIVYGSGLENVLLKLKTVDFAKAFKHAGESNLIDLEIEGQGSFKVLIKEVQRDPVKDFFVHVDFYKVDMDKEITTEIPLEFIGESKAVKELGAMLIKSIDQVEVECLPKDLVDHIDIDISVLAEIGDSLQIKDIKWPKGLKILNNEEDALASIVEPRVEEEVAPTPVAETVASETSKDDKTTTKDKEEEKK
jgi:large subunit ribosomal protein L25